MVKEDELFCDTLVSLVVELGIYSGNRDLFTYGAVESNVLPIMDVEKDVRIFVLPLSLSTAGQTLHPW